jgi:hypothetical protein
MKNLKMLSLAMLGLTALAGCVVGRSGQGGQGWSLCGNQAKMRIVDLDISPDPIAQGQQIRSWRVVVQADTDGECATTLQVQERPGNITVGTRRIYYFRPGLNEVTVQPDVRYRFSQARHCFVVIADIEETPRAIDARGNFCAQREGNNWTMAGR